MKVPASLALLSIPAPTMVSEGSSESSSPKACLHLGNQEAYTLPRRRVNKGSPSQRIPLEDEITRRLHAHILIRFLRDLIFTLHV